MRRADLARSAFQFFRQVGSARARVQLRRFSLVSFALFFRGGEQGDVHFSPRSSQA